MIDPFYETLETLIAQHGGNMAALGRKIGFTGNYISMIRDKKRGKKPAEFIEKVRETFGIDMKTGKPVVTDVTRGTHQTLSVREDVWQEIRTSNEFYRDQHRELLGMMRDKDKELLSMLRSIIQGGIIPKQA